MRLLLLIVGGALFGVAAILLFAGSAAVNPLGLIACGLICTTASSAA